MSDSISRRDFLKKTSAVGLAAAVTPMATLAAPASAKTRVVIATDKACISATGGPVAAKIQDVVDNAIMTLSGKPTKGAAYEALFPAAVTSSTKILLKRNEASGKGAINTAVTNAFKTGLTSMLNGTFPAANITIRILVGSVKSQIDATTYLINCPVCWVHSDDYGVTLSCKNTMPYLNNASVYHSANKAWLYNVSLDPAIKPKQVLSLMDAMIGNNTQQGGAGSASSFIAGTLIVSKDLVAVDYNALRLMEKQPNPSASRIATGDNQLKAAQTAGLGTCTPANMEIINIAPPWTTGTINEPETNRPSLEIEVLRKGNGVEFLVPRASSQSVDVTIFDMMGNVVRNIPNNFDKRILWDNRTQNGSLAPSGMYAFLVRNGGARARGIVVVVQ
jgi:hypothetical protein